MSRWERVLSAMLALSIVPEVTIPAYYGWIHLSLVADAIVSGLAILLLTASGALWWHSWYSDKKRKKCTGCRGTKKVLINTFQGGPQGGLIQEWVKCSWCKGTGKEPDA